MQATLRPPRRQHRAPLLGDLVDFQKRPLALLLDLANNYGPVTTIRFGPFVQFAVTEPEGALQVLQRNHRSYRKQQQFMDAARIVLLSGDDLFTSDGDAWLQRRRLMQPAFHRKVVASFAEIITGETDRLLSVWQDGQVVDMEQAMMDITMGIIGHSMLSHDILQRQPRLYHAFEMVSGFVLDRATKFTVRLTPLFVPTARNRAFKRALALIRQELGGIVRQRQAQPAEERPHDLLTMLMAGRDEESGFTLATEQLMDELFGIVTAGHETSSVTLAWLFYELARHPEVQARLHAELDAVLAGRTPTVDDLPQLPTVQALIEETLRRYPAAYVTTREALADDQIGGYPIPKGATVLVNIYGLHHHRDYWDDPMSFAPDRWTDPKHQATRGAFLPFGDGPRKCIGEPLARLEMQLIVAMMGQRFRLRLAERPSALVARFTLRSKDGVWLVAEARPDPVSRFSRHAET